jgi:serine/threonine protein kinase
MTRMSMQGSVYWMAPEQARGKGYSAKVDIWSCGCLVLEMLTGHVPWHKVRGNVLYLLGTGNSPPIPDDLSDSAKTFLTESFTLDPEKRPTASILLDHSFTDIDPSSVDFVTWSQDAAQRRLEEGTTSEEKSDSEEDFEEEEELFDYDGIEDDEDEEGDD